MGLGHPVAGLLAPEARQVMAAGARAKLVDALTALGGAERFARVAELRVRLRATGGVFGDAWRAAGEQPLHLDPAAMRAAFPGFGGPTRRAWVEDGKVKVVKANGALVTEKSSAGLWRIGRLLGWESADFLLMGAPAAWAALAAPYVLVEEGWRLVDLGTWYEGGQSFWRLGATPPGEGPASMQSFCFDGQGRLVRHDHPVAGFGPFLTVSRYAEAFQESDGLVWPTRVRYVPVGPLGLGPGWPSLLEVELEGHQVLWQAEFEAVESPEA